MSAPVSVHARGLVAVAPLPTRWGMFECSVFRGAGVEGDDGYLEAKRVRMEHRLRPAA